jgi:hypothetical protein
LTESSRHPKVFAPLIPEPEAVMRRSALALLFVVGLVFVPTSSSACWKCSQKLKCYGQDCWIEWFCNGYMVFNERGFAECRETIGGCVYEGEICKWVALPEGKYPKPSFLRQEMDYEGPLVCASAS